MSRCLGRLDRFLTFRPGAAGAADPAAHAPAPDERLEQLLRLTRENRELDATVRRVREWNTSLLADKQRLLDHIAQQQHLLDRADRVLDDVSRKLAQASQDRDQAEREHALAQSDLEACHADLARAVEQCARLTKQIEKTKGGRR